MKKDSSLALNLILIVCLVFLAGCVSEKKYNELLDTWVGSQEITLVESWGPPDHVYNYSESEKFLTYANSRNVTFPGSQPTYTTTIYGNTAYTTSYGGSPPTNINFRCKTTFRIKDGTIVSWQWKGNNCVAR